MYMHFALNDYLTSAEDLEPPSDAVVAVTAKVKGESDEGFNVEFNSKLLRGGTLTPILRDKII